MSDEQMPSEVDPEAVPRPPRRTMPSWLIPTVTGVAGLLVGAAVVGGVWMVNTVTSDMAATHQKEVTAKAASKAKSEKAKILQSAVDSCGLSGNLDADLEDNGYSLTVNGRGNDDISGLSVEDEACVLTELDASSAVISHIDQTTSMDGRQSETWNGVTFSWSYHPDRGLDGVFTLQK